MASMAAGELAPGAPPCGAMCPHPALCRDGRACLSRGAAKERAMEQALVLERERAELRRELEEERREVQRLRSRLRDAESGRGSGMRGRQAY